MPYDTVLKRFKALLRFVNGRYYGDIETVLNRLQMSLKLISDVLYMVDIQLIELSGDLE